MEKIKEFLRRERHRLEILWYDTKSLVINAKRRIWNKHILLWWYRLWVRKDEFHESLYMDPFAMAVMNEREKSKYCKNLEKRRNISHKRDLSRSEE